MRPLSPRGAALARWLLLYALYFTSRLVALTALPIFLDERIHLRWAFWITQGHRLRLPFISGRGLNVWLLAAVVPWTDRLLLAGRALTVAIGTLTLWACHGIAERLYGRRVALMAALFYVICPFALFYDRMILADAFLSAFAALTLLLSIDLARTPRTPTALLLGLALGLAIASKTTGLLLLGVPVLAILLLRRPITSAIRPLAVAFAIAGAIAAYPLWLFFRKTAELGGAVGVRENEVGRVANALANLSSAAAWLWAYWTPGLTLLAVAGLAHAFARRERVREALLLALLCTGTPLAFVAVAQIWYPRYLLFTVVPLVVLAAAGAEALIERGAQAGPRVHWAARGALAIALLPALWFDYRLWSGPSRAPLPLLDRFQYVVGWPSGYGVTDTIEYLERRVRDHPDGITVITSGPSVAAGVLRPPFFRDARVEIAHIDPSQTGALDILRALSRVRPTYLLISRVQGGQLPADWSLLTRRLFISFKPDGTLTDEIYRVCEGEMCVP